MWAEFWQLIAMNFRRQFAPLVRGREVWTPGLLLFFLSLLALILFSGLLNGVDPLLATDILTAVFWLLFFAVFSFDAARIWDEDLRDGTLDQSFVEAGGSYLPLLVSQAFCQFLAVYAPLSLVFVCLWVIGSDLPVPLSSLLALSLPIIALRLFASALALSSRGGFGVGSLLFLSFSAIFYFLSVTGRADLIWALGLILSPAIALVLPIIFRLSHRAR